MMNKHKIISGLISCTLALSGLGITTSSFAGHKHHHHSHDNHRKSHSKNNHHDHHDHHDHNKDLAVGLSIGALFGALAIASTEHNGHYHPHNCHQAMVRKSCHRNYWGHYSCHRVRYVRNVC